MSNQTSLWLTHILNYLYIFIYFLFKTETLNWKVDDRYRKLLWIYVFEENKKRIDKRKGKKKVEKLKNPRLNVSQGF